MQLKKHLTPIISIFLLQLIVVILMSVNLLPLETRYLLTLFLAVCFLILNLSAVLRLFIISIPLFVAIPLAGVSDSMSSWRILAVVLFVKFLWEKIRSCRWLHSPEGLWSRYAVSQLGSIGLTPLWSQRIPLLTKEGLGEVISKIKKLPYYNLLIFFTVFIFISLLSLAVAQNIGVGVKKIFFLVNAALLFPIVVSVIKSREQLLKIIKAVFFAAAFTLLVGYGQLLATFFVPLFKFWQFWAGEVIEVLYGQNLSRLLSYSNTWFSYYDTLPATLRMFSVMPDSHSFAMFILLTIPFTLFLTVYYSQKKEEKIPLAPFYKGGINPLLTKEGLGVVVFKLVTFLILSLLAIIFSGSRGIWLTSIFGLLAGIYLLSPYKFLNLKPHLKKIKLTADNKRQSALIIFSVVIFFLVIPLSNFTLKQNQIAQLSRAGLEMSDEEKSAFLKRALSISDLSETSNKGRLEIWLATFPSVFKHPFLGVGAGNFPVILEQNYSASKMGSSAHNLYLEIAAEIGLFGLAAFLFILAEILQKSYRLFRRLKNNAFRIFAGGFFAYAVWAFGYGLFDVVLLNDKVLMLLMISVGVLYSLEGVEGEE